MPNEGVPGQFHVVLGSKIHKGVRRSPVITVFPRAGMQVHPLHLVLGYDLIELRLHQRDVRFDLIVTAPPAFAGGHTTVDARSYFEVRLVGVLERGGMLR